MYKNISLTKLFSRVFVADLNLVWKASLKGFKEPIYPPLNENDVREEFIKGSGPGGQSVNKTVNRCQLKHIPTGIIVTCHETRSLEENRKKARKMLQQQIDLHYNKEESYLAKLAKFKKQEKIIKNKKSVDNLKRKKEFKEREDL